MTNLYEDVKKHVVMMLRNKEAPNAEQIKQYISVVVQMQRQLGRTEDLDEAAMYRDMLSHVSTWQANAAVLRDRKHKPWLPERKLHIEWNFWKRYRQYLEEEKFWPTDVTARLDATTDSILGDIGNPANHQKWDLRGMVVGEVQSGKTANYTGLICKAVDAGYKLIIVLAGLTNDLRSQTQSRLDAEFLGFESEVGKSHGSGSRIGVGKIDAPGQLLAQPLTYSARDGDFRANKSANLQLGGTPILLVVKKNASVLKRILTWVQNQGKPHPETGKKIVDSIPLLLLDDEADNASVNTKSEDEDPTTINRAIRLILNSFQQCSYVGYTATPFANIFILPDDENKSEYGEDLFPKGFIYYIKPPSNYVGPAQLFGLTEDLDGGDKTTDGLPLIRDADDAKSVFPLSHKKELVIGELPLSMIEALRCFVITCAARRVRGHKDVHNSMLIHVTRFNLVQRQVMDLVTAELVSMQRMIEYNTGPQAADLIKELERMWNDDYAPTCETVSQRYTDPQLAPVQWKEVRDQLLPAVTKIVVRGVNGDAGGVLDYDDNPSGLNVIAVGGDKLSRGLTLEGLSVSYYVRPAKNYDTLLQMGRWFGYRPGYVDLCRLYTTGDLEGWYQHIAVASEELRREFNFMEISRLTPEDYGLKVRTHPDELSITSANKIRHGRTMRVSFSGHLAQTVLFHKNADVHAANFTKTEQWIRSLPTPDTEIPKKPIIWKNISPEKLIEFLAGYTTHPLCRQAEPDLLVNYIRKLNGFGELTNWTVALVSGGDSNAPSFSIAGRDIWLTARTPPELPSDLYMLRNSNIISPTHQYIDLTSDQIQEALNKTKYAWHQKKDKKPNAKEPENPSGPFVRKTRASQNGLLLLYPLNHISLDPQFSDVPIFGFAISFPESSRAESSAIEYQVNTKYWRDRYGEEDDDVA